MKTIQGGNLIDYPRGAIKPFVSFGVSASWRANKQDVRQHFYLKGGRKPIIMSGKIRKYNNVGFSNHK